MNKEFKPLREFGKCRLDVEKKFLWCNDQPVQLPLKAIELLCVLVESGGTVVTKDEIWQSVWQNSFVEETNLTHNIYLLWKTFKGLGEPDLIKTVPSRGYRFAGKVREVENGNGEIVIEHHALTQTLIEEISSTENEIKSQKRANAKITKTTAGFLEDEKPTRIAPALAKTNHVYLTFALVLFLALSTVGSIWYFRSNPTATVKNPVKTIAILPLQSLNKEDDDKAFGLGITESLVSRLGNLEQLVVRPTGSVKQISESEIDSLEIGRKSKADAVMTGNFQRADGRIRVTIRLLNVADGSQIWAGAFDENETDIFKLQDSLSAQIADSLVAKLPSDERQQLASRPTEDFEAYKLYLRGRYAWNKRTREGFADSIRFYQAAIDRDPTFALAYAGLADTYVLLNDYNVAAPDEAYPKAKAAAFKALEIDPNLIEPRTTIAFVLATYDWNFPEAEREYRRVIEINPNYVTAHQWYSELLYTVKRFAEAEIELKRAAELDPLAPIIQSELGVVMYYSGKYDEAIAHWSKLKQEFPNFPTTYVFSAWAFEQKQMPDESFAEEIVFWKLQGVDEATLGELERARRQEGHRDYLREIAMMLEKAAQGGHLFMEYRLVHIYARLGDREKTLEWLEKAIKKHSSSIIKVNLDPNFDFLRDDERFQTLQREFQRYQ